ncbi:SO_0444 family Cu/Zn efflux transporter [Aquisalimonas lutea]|uniref:SO_0444 family Cu/Zn efflux transporter n=1 Tax=Aquisalimonas lutea TaxID=1327750 RepID=UPI0025B33FB6|nr:SO_0444 family Cu/Zn efflux transporter [Aquisalimonas lutea]MDN3519256.1 SO_0444 family Cu/Zn efflux transporter [Aquisalimonas lutea]
MTFNLLEIASVALSAAPWLLLGLLAAGLVRALIPQERLGGWLGGAGPAAVLRGAVAGTPLPLCSCGAIPTALSLHRSGAGRGPTTAFLVSTPGVGVDSMAITYALLGPVMLAGRVLGAFATAVAAGLLVARFGTTAAAPAPGKTAPADDCCGTGAGDDDCCGTGAGDDDCCSAGAGDDDCCSRGETAASPLGRRLQDGVRYAFTTLLDDISGWLFAGLLVAGILMTFFPPQTLASVGSGLLPMLLMAVIGVPMYICATAATPVAAAMLFAGISPGTVLVFLLAGPVTSLATLGAYRKELGTATLLVYLAAIVASTVALGVALDAAIAGTGLAVAPHAGAAGEWLPQWLRWAALALLVGLSIRPVRRLGARTLRRRPGSTRSAY